MSGYSRFDVDLTGALEAMQSMRATPGRIVQAQKRALSTVRRRLATEAKRDIGAEYNLKAGRIAQGLVVRDAPDGVRVIGRSRGINAIEFGATWSRRMKVGARFSVLRGGARDGEPDSFIAVGANGKRLVFERGGKKAVRNAHGNLKRYPIKTVTRNSIAQMLKHGRRPQRLRDFAIRVLQAEQQRLLGMK